MESAPLDFATRNWVEAAIGPVKIVSRFAHDHGYSNLWRLRAGRETVWLKCHRYPGKWAGEVHSLTRWTEALNLDAPRVLAYRTDPPAVLLTEIPGDVAEGVALDHAAEVRLWRDAGLYLNRLHALENPWLGAVNVDGTPQGETQSDPVAFVREGIERRLAQGTEQGLFDAEEQAFIADRARVWSEALRGETPRAIHRDYSPRNWMTRSDGALLGVIDFEHARWDIRAADLNRWWDTDFVGKPHLADAFFDAYRGGLPDEILRAQIRALRLLGAAGGIVWATGVGDAAFAAGNREALRRLRDEREI